MWNVECGMLSCAPMAHVELFNEEFPYSTLNIPHSSINIAHRAIIQHSTLNIQHSKWLSISPKCSVSSTVPINTAHSSTSMPGRAVRAKSSTTRDGSSIMSTGVAVTSAFAILRRVATVCFARYHRCSSSASTTNKSTYEQK